MVIESDTVDDIRNAPEGTRFYIVNFTDGDTGTESMIATTVEPEQIAYIDQHCAETGVAFHVGLKQGALSSLASRVWEGGDVPEGTEVHLIAEVSRRELIGFMERSEQGLAEAVKS